MSALRYLSRRQFLQGTASLTLASAANAAGQPFTGWKTCAAASSADDVPAPAAPPRETARRLTVPVHIDGKGPYRFIVDTGADRTVVATEVGMELGLARGEKVLLDGVVQT